MFGGILLLLGQSVKLYPDDRLLKTTSTCTYSHAHQPDASDHKTSVPQTKSTLTEQQQLLTQQPQKLIHESLRLHLSAAQHFLFNPLEISCQDTRRSQAKRSRRRLTDNKGLFEGGPCDVVPRRSAGRVDGPFVRPQQWRLRLRLAGGPFGWG